MIAIYFIIGGLMTFYNLGFVLKRASIEKRDVSRLECALVILMPILWLPLVMVSVGKMVAERS